MNETADTPKATRNTTPPSQRSIAEKRVIYRRIRPTVKKTIENSGLDLADPLTRHTVQSVAFDAAASVDEDAQREIDTQGATITAQEQDISKLTIEKEDALKRAGIDSLTRLPNRERFDENLENRIAEAQKTGRSFYLLFFDIDHFKDVNDAYGHSMGDAVLRRIKELRRISRLEEDIYRYGGEEFTQIAENDNEQELIHLIRRYQSLMINITSELFAGATVVENMKDGTTVREMTDFSIGIAKFQPDDTPKSLVDRADSAMRHAKKHEDTVSFAHSDSRGATHYRQIK
jgi:diguanylate cyclase (GGDEF)-like protein